MLRSFLPSRGNIALAVNYMNPRSVNTAIFSWTVRKGGGGLGWGVLWLEG